MFLGVKRGIVATRFVRELYLTIEQEKLVNAERLDEETDGPSSRMVVDQHPKSPEFKGLARINFHFVQLPPKALKHLSSR